MRDMTHMSLFTGIGGLDIAAEMAGFETVGQCEFADYPYRVLCKHWPYVQKWRDIRTLTGESFHERTGRRTVDVISGGFPCQPFSVAGKQLGKQDERYLWPEMLRVIRELAPRWVIAENVPGILRIAGDTVCQDLEREGFDVGVFSYEAAAVGASHRRGRVFFVANARCRSTPRQQQRRSTDAYETERGDIKNTKALPEKSAQTIEPERTGGHRSDEALANTLRIKAERDDKRGFLHQSAGGSQDLADANNEGLQIGRYEPRHEAVHGEIGAKYGSSQEFEIRRWWAVEPSVGRVAHGVPNEKVAR